MNTKLRIILTALWLVSFCACQNSTFSDSNSTALTNDKNSWCRITNVADRRYSQNEKDYYRSKRSSLFNDNFNDAFRYYINGDSTSWINIERWPIALAIVIAGLAFIFWMVWLWFCCTKNDESVSDSKAMKGCVLAAWVILFLFIGLFIFIMIMMAFSEVSYRRSACQLYKLGSFLVDGFVDEANGNNYIGLSNLYRVIDNIQYETNNLPLAYEAANSIVVSNIAYWSAGAKTALNKVYIDNSELKNTGSLKENTQTNQLSNLIRTITPQIGNDFNKASDTVNAVISASEAVRTMTNPTNNQFVIPTLNQVKVVIQQAAGDVATTNNWIGDRAWWKQMYNRGGYWSIFGISFVVIALVIVILSYLGALWGHSSSADNRSTMKVLLAVLGFFLVWYAIGVIFLIIGNMAVSSFCGLLKNVNDGNVAAVDTLGVQWNSNVNYGLSRAILKECTVGSGNLLNLVYANPASVSNFNPAIVNVADSLIRGILANKAWSSNPRKTQGSPALNNYFSGLTLQAQGVQEGAIGLNDEIQKLNDLLAASNQKYSPTLAACSAFTNGTNCVAGDQLSGATSVSSNANAADALPYFNNLKAFIQSESATAASLKTQLSSTNLTAQFQYQTAEKLLNENQLNWNQILRSLPVTSASLHSLRTSLSLLDCRSLQVELNMLEDHLCFELNFWVNLITIISAISLILLIILLWVVYAAIKNAPVPGHVDTIPEPMTKEDPALDINDKELIPNM